MKDGIKKRVFELLRVAVGTFCMALAVNLIYEPLGMVTGGISGFSIVLQKLALIWYHKSLPVWLSNLLLNIPIFLAALRIKGREYIGITFFANITFTAALYFIPVLAVPQKDYLLAAVVGGVLSGVGLGLVFSRGYSTGGTDLLGAILHHFFPYYPVGQILFVLDSLVILAGAWLFGIRVEVYAMIAVYLTSKLIDAIVEGGKFAKLAFIISDSYEEIGKEVMRQLGRGVTVLDGMGMFTRKEKKTLLCVVDRKQIVRVSQIAYQHDENAFVIISDIREVQGEGFVEKPQL